MPKVWNKSVVHSYSNLRNFFTKSDAINQVISKKHKRTTRTLTPLNPNLSFKWRVCQIATAPLRAVPAVVLDIISKISSLPGENKLSTYTRDGRRFLVRGFEDSTKIFRIQSAVNRPDLKGQVVNNTPFIPEDQITDQKVKNKTLRSAAHGIKFNHHQGICRGMSNWFIYLYLNTKEHFSDPRSHMCALGKQFKNGGGQEATLLQSIRFKKGKLLGLKVGTQAAHCPDGITPLHQFTTAEWNSKKSEMVHQLQDTPAGAYLTWVPRHATVYIKVHDSLGFFFDPNHGITEINGPAQGEQLYKLISTVLSDIGEDNASDHKAINMILVTRRDTENLSRGPEPILESFSV